MGAAGRGSASQRENLLCLSAWPVFEGLADAEADEEIGWLVKLISEVRSVRSEMNVPAGAKIPLVLVGAGKATRARAERHEETIKRLARLETISFAKARAQGLGADRARRDDGGAAAGRRDRHGRGAGAARRARSRSRRPRSRKVDAKLANESFVAKAPPEVVEENRERKADFEATVKKLQAALKRVEAAAVGPLPVDG